MDTFDYLSVLFSVILGLALTQILQGLRGLMLARSRVRLYAPPLIWAALMVLLVAQAWWAMFQMHHIGDWTFAMYGAIVLQMVLIYLAAGMVLPDVPPEGHIDMRQDYFAQARWFFGLMALVILATVLKDLVTTGRPTTGWNAGYLGFFFALSTVAVFTKARWYHWMLAPFSAAVVVVYTALLSMRL